MAKLYRIIDWTVHFENNRTRELKRMSYVCVPNKQDGDGYTELLDHPNGAAHFGAFMALVEAASKVGNGPAERGILMRDTGIPHDERSLARTTRVPVGIWTEALCRLEAIGWISSEDYDGKQVGASPQDVGTNCRPTADEVSTACGASSDLNGLDLNGSESKDPTRARAREGSGFCKDSVLTEDSLRDPDAVDRWRSHEIGGDLCECNRRRPPEQRRPREDAIVDGSDGTKFNVQAAAAKASTAPGIRDRLAVFKWLVKGRHWDFLRCSDDDFAASLRRIAAGPNGAFIDSLLEPIGQLTEDR